MRNLYFAYGSNIDKDQMQKRCPEAQFVGNGILDGYRFIINRRGYATLLSTENAFVPGIVWRLTANDEPILDSYEGHKKGIYDKCYRKVRTSDGQEFFCLLYIDHCNQALGPPNQGYLEKIIKGAREFELPASHICLLSSWPAKKNFKAFNKLINQIDSATIKDKKIAYYNKEILSELKNQRDSIFLEAMRKILEDLDDDFEDVDEVGQHYSPETFESAMLKEATVKAIDIAETCFANEIKNLVQDCYSLEKFQDKINALRAQDNIVHHINRISDVDDHRERPYEIATAGIIITDDPVRVHSEGDKVIVTKNANLLEALWQYLIHLEKEQICTGSFSLLFLEHFADAAESWSEGNEDGLARELLNRVESSVNQRKKELQDAINRTIDEITTNDDLEEDDV